MSDPDGVVWEAFHTTGEATVYGAGPELEAISAASPNAAPSQCCAPKMP